MVLKRVGLQNRCVIVQVELDTGRKGSGLGSAGKQQVAGHNRTGWSGKGANRIGWRDASRILRSANANAGVAEVVQRAQVTVVATSVVVRGDATGSRVARIVGAGITIIANRCRSTHAGAGGAGVGGGARVAVVAGGRVGGVHTTSNRVARIVGTNIAVIAVQRRSTNTGTRGAGIGGGASIAVVTTSGVVGVDASRCGIARVVCTNVSVIATQRRSANASAQRTGVSGGARIAVVATRGVVGADTAGGRVARIVGTHVAVVAVWSRTTNASTRSASVGSCARVTVVTSSVVVRGDATGSRVARIVGTYVAIVANQRRSTHTGTSRAGVSRCASVAVIT